MSILWTEKYRPKDILTFESSAYIKKLLNSSSPNDFPNLLLYGPPGTGKTTFAHLIASKNKLELNASDERGINVIRDTIKSYASTLKKDKTIILDECENLTKDAQYCLRRIIEDSKNTRFIFTTNYLSKVISPLKSRLVKIKFEIQENTTLSAIGKAEKLNFSEEFYKDLFKKCNYDLRRSINVLQGLAPIEYILNKDVRIEDVDNIEIFDTTKSENLISTINQNNLVDDIIGIIPKTELIKFRDITKSTYINFIDSFLFKGYSVLQLIYQLAELDLFNIQINMAKFHLLLAELEAKLIVGCSDETVLTKICLYKISLH